TKSTGGPLPSTEYARRTPSEELKNSTAAILSPGRATTKMPPDRHRERPDQDGPEQQPGEDRDRLDALASLPLPVDVAEIEPERELVEDERREDAVGERGQPEPEPPRLLLEREEEKPQVADEQHPDDPEDEMVDVDAADDDPAVRAGAVVVEPRGDPARDRQPDEEAERREHRPLASRAEVMVQVEAFLHLLDDLVLELAGFGHRHGR